MALFDDMKEAAVKFDRANMPDRALSCVEHMMSIDEAKAYSFLRRLRARWARLSRESAAAAKDYMKYVRRLYILGARVSYEDYLIAVEFDTPYENKFYLPRREYLTRIGLVAGYQDILDGKLDLLTISLPKRAGKALTLDTLLPTPTGMVRMGDVRVGDFVMGADGKRTRVEAVYLQGAVECYEVRFTDGSKVEASGEHLWKVRYHNTHKPYGECCYEDRVMTTDEIRRTGVKSSGRRNRHSLFSIERCSPVEFDYRPNLGGLSPYVLGVLLGDGYIASGTPYFTSFDPEIPKEVSRRLGVGDVLTCQDAKKGRYSIHSKGHPTNSLGYPTKCETAAWLDELGLLGKHSWDKFIPEEYLFAPVEARKALLAGLLDTDGGVENGRSVSYTTVSPALRDGVVFLAKSLGGQVSVHEKKGRYLKDGEVVETRLSYRISMQFPSSFNPFFLSRKRNALKCNREKLYLYIDEIVPIGKKEAQCICVDNADKMYLATEDFVPTHNSQSGINFVTMLSGRYPYRASLMEGTGDDLVDSFYKGCLQYVSNDNGYLFSEIFPNSGLERTKADTHIIDLGEQSRFPTIMCRSIDARQVGLSEATNVLYLDDCVEGREEAKNRNRMDAKWEVINGDVLGRAIEGTPVVATGTRYSIYDPIGRLQERFKELHKRVKTIEVPALDLVTDESNYEYFNPKLGRKVFTTEYFRNERKSLSEEQFESEFQQQPFEAKGLLFPAEGLNRYFELPSEHDPDYVYAACDTAEDGADYTAMVVASIYGDDVYIQDVVYDNSPPDVTKPECSKKLVDNKVGAALFESNGAGAYFARDVEEAAKKMGAHCSVTTKRTLTNKRTRIELASDNIKKHFYFLDESLYKPNSQYAQALRELTTYTRLGRVPHDDFTDVLSLLENAIRDTIGVSVEIVRRPF